MMKLRRKRKIDWPGVALAVAQQFPHPALHPAALARAAEERRRHMRGGGKEGRSAVAFSGGADSLALLLLLWAARESGRWGGEVVALHFNHRLRGRAAELDERFCADVCAALRIKFVAGRWSEAQRGASEAEARSARYAFFSRELRRRRLHVLWLAHHQDDIAETMLMRLARGSGTAGLAAPRPVQVVDGLVRLRPLLTLRKQALIDGLASAGAVWREDATNASDAYFRTRVRRTVLPAWVRAAGRDAVAGAALARERLEEDDAALEAWVDSLAPLKRGCLHLEKLQGKPVAVWRRALHRWLMEVRPETDLSRQGFDRLLTVVREGKDTRFSVGRGRFAVVRAGRLELRKS